MRITMDLENTKYENCQKNFHNKCKFCGKELKPIGLDYLYTNISSELIEYERCTCKESKDYWKDIDFRIQEQKKKEHYREIISQFYSQNYISKRIKNCNFKVTDVNKKEVEIVKDYTQKCIDNKQENELIITEDSGVGKTHLVASISNELIEKDKLVVIDNLGTEKISQWALDKLYTIIENRNENKLPIIITTKFDKEGLLHRFKQSNDKELADAIIQKLYQLCYGIELKRYNENQKEQLTGIVQRNV